MKEEWKESAINLIAILFAHLYANAQTINLLEEMPLRALIAKKRIQLFNICKLNILNHFQNRNYGLKKIYTVYIPTVYGRIINTKIQINHEGMIKLAPCFDINQSIANSKELINTIVSNAIDDARNNSNIEKEYIEKIIIENDLYSPA